MRVLAFVLGAVLALTSVQASRWEDLTNAVFAQSQCSAAEWVCDGYCDGGMRKCTHLASRQYRCVPAASEMARRLESASRDACSNCRRCNEHWVCGYYTRGSTEWSCINAIDAWFYMGLDRITKEKYERVSGDCCKNSNYCMAHTWQCQPSKSHSGWYDCRNHNLKKMIFQISKNEAFGRYGLDKSPSTPCGCGHWACDSHSNGYGKRCIHAGTGNYIDNLDYSTYTSLSGVHTRNCNCDYWVCEYEGNSATNPTYTCINRPTGQIRRHLAQRTADDLRHSRKCH
ncbi:MAG: hypothetical protein MHM6MM_004472 [Cercozoa sp. M6MM]